MDYWAAKALYTARCPYNETYFPYREDDVFIEVTIPIEDIRLSEGARRGEFWSEKAKTNILNLMEISELHPIWVNFLVFDGHRWKPHWDKKVRIVDGNHRTTVNIRQGSTTIDTYFPVRDYDAYRITKRN